MSKLSPDEPKGWASPISHTGAFVGIGLGLVLWTCETRLPPETLDFMA